MINLNGKLVANDKASLSITNRGFAYGDAVFETIRVVNGKVIFWEDHYFRLMASMRIMRMEIPATFSPEFLEKEILNLVKENELDATAARVKFSVYREEGGYYRPKTKHIGYLISVENLPQAFYQLNEKNYEIELFKDHYITSGLLATIKSNNRAINVLGSIYADENYYENCLLLNEKKHVVEALNGNIFLVKGDTIKTPPLSDGTLNGITRKKLLEIIKKEDDLKLEEVTISPFELQKADELFITNVITGVQPITKYRKKSFDNKVAKNLLSKLNVKAKLG